MQAASRLRPVLTCGSRAVHHGDCRWASSGFASGLAGSMRAPKGYYLPRLAVGSCTLVGSIVLYDLIAEALQRFTGPTLSDCRVWDPEWDSNLPPPQAGDSPEAAAQLIAKRLRVSADAQVERRHLVFVRHAQPTDADDAKATPTPLTSTGCKQAEATAKRLQALFGEDITTVYHAGSTEARATAEAFLRTLAKGRATGEEPQLVESVLLAESIPSVPSPTPPGFHIDEVALVQDAARAEGAFAAHIWRPVGNKEADGPASVEVLVAPGNVIRYLACRALQLPETAWSRLAASHCTITWLEIGCDGAVLLREFGGVGHLPPELITYY